jgi:methyl-accepting chemotaxis protein
MRKTSLSNKIGLVVAVGMILSILILGIYNSLTLRNELIEGSKKNTFSLAEKYSSLIKAKIEVALDASRILAHGLSAVYQNDHPLYINRSDVISMSSEILRKNPDFLGIAALYKANSFDGRDSSYRNASGATAEGIFAPYISLDENKNPVVEAVNLDEIPPQKNIEVIMDPYIYTVQGQGILMITAVAPVNSGSNHYGNIAIDIELSYVHKLITEKNSDDDATEISVVSNEGIYAGHNKRQEELAGKKITEDYFCSVEEQLTSIKSGQEKIIVHDDILYVEAPIYFGNTDTPWQVRISVPMSQITKAATNSILTQILISAILLVLTIAVVVYFVKARLQPLTKFVGTIGDIANGKLYSKIDIKTNDEVGQIGESLKKMTDMIREIVGQIHDSTTEISGASKKSQPKLTKSSFRSQSASFICRRNFCFHRANACKH